ncbi:MAG: DUF2061 domain-containing protein [Xanthobacteraceae bacterium]|nr:DUF2061 domain-containing protein [Xanthobacteraceae bacterium]MBV9630126.1 DUF2061 domain-containing protein [Xanthobacteraceae bacterium]
MNRYLAVGLTVVAGAALVEAALIPGVVLGGAAVLAPRYLPKLRRGLAPLLNLGKPGKPQARTARPAQPQTTRAQSAFKLPVALPGRLGISQAVGKTITFRIIVTALDFTSNLVVLGEAATAAGLSGFALVAGPVFYLVHETAWNYYGPSEQAGDRPVLRVRLPQSLESMTGRTDITISRALAKTITFRTLATIMDFTTIYVVVGDLATAAGLSAFGFVVGPFVYWGHEKAWEYYTSPDRQPVALLPKPNLRLSPPA